MEKKEKRKVLINKVNKRILDIWPPSVKNGLEDETQISDFEDKIKIGQGSFGQVFHAKHKKTGAIYAIKAIDKKNKTNQEGKTYFRREIEIMYKIKHPNIVRLYTHFEDNDNCYFVMEYISKGNLYENLQKQKKKCFDTKTVAFFMRDLLSAVYYLHKMDPPIVHRDLKLENILLADNGQLKLTDFGWSNYICDDEIRDTFCGTPVYQAPEMINRKEHDHNVDIWALGVIMFEVLTGYLPFNAVNKETLEESIKKVKINWPNDIDRAAKDLIGKILRYDPKHRISIENMFCHPFLTSVLPNPMDFLIKPNQEKDLEIYIISIHTPSSEKEKEKIQNQPLPNDNLKNLNNKDNNEETQLLKTKLNDYCIKIKNLEEQLTVEQAENRLLKNKIELVEKEKEYLISQLNNKKDIKESESDSSLINKMNTVTLEEHTNKVESLDNLQVINQNLIKEIENLNERIDLNKEFYIKHLTELEKQVELNLIKNQNNIENSMNTLRESLSQMKPTDELNEAKEKFEKEIKSLKDVMTKEREKYNFVIQNNIEELNKLHAEKNAVKESTARYYEKIILKYDEKLKQKSFEAEELKLKIKKLEEK